MNTISRCALLTAAIALSNSTAWASNAYPLFTDINAAPLDFGSAAAGSFGTYTLNSAAKLGGNDVLSINQTSNVLTCCHGATIVINVSNGENGVNSTQGGANTDIPNATPANVVFSAIGNPSGKLENGNVLRVSAWFRSDPANPITVEPQVPPILKFEFWKEGLSTNADLNAQQQAPNFGDRVFDQDQQGYALMIPDLPGYVDINGDGKVLQDPNATVANGRLIKIAADHWTRLAVTYTVDSSEWLGIGAEQFGANNVGSIESIRAVMMMGNFAGSFAGDGPDGGNLLVDNALVEVFRNANSVTPLNNPNPDAPEPSSFCLALLALLSARLVRRRKF